MSIMTRQTAGRLAFEDLDVVNLFAGFCIEANGP